MNDDRSRSKCSNTLFEIISDGSLSELLSIETCKSLADNFGGNKAAIIISSTKNVSPSACSSGVHSQSTEDYENYFYKIDPMNNAHSFNAPVKMSEVISKNAFTSSEFYNDFFRPMNSYYSLATKRRISSTNTIEIAINRGKQSSDFTDADKRAIKRIITLLSARVGILNANAELAKDYRQTKLDLVATLSARELEVFLTIATGGSVEKFSSENNVSINTARTLAKAVRLKLQADSQMELTKIARIIA